jgi:hypothetical protein
MPSGLQHQNGNMQNLRQATANALGGAMSQAGNVQRMDQWVNGALPAGVGIQFPQVRNFVLFWKFFNKFSLFLTVFM